MVEEERKGFLITDVKSCTEGFNPKWSNTLVYEVQTEQGDRLFLEMTIDVVKKFRTMPERLPPWLGRLAAKPAKFPREFAACRCVALRIGAVLHRADRGFGASVSRDHAPFGLGTRALPAWDSKPLVSHQH